MSDAPLSEPDHRTAARVTAQLQREADSLNDIECAKLAAARRRALSRPVSEPTRWAALTPPRLSMAAAAVLALAVAVPLLTTNGSLQETTTAVAEANTTGDMLGDLPLLANSDDVEFLQDLEFLMWLETQEDNAT